jgi:hypothetical protein
MQSRNKNATAPTIGQWSLAGTLLGVSLGASCIAGAMNWHYGIKSSMEQAVIFVLAEVVLFITPLLATEMGGWNVRRRTAWAVALVISLFTASCHLLEMQAQKMKDAQAVSAVLANARADVDAARAELAKIAETGDAATLEAQHGELKAKADRESSRGGCRAKCEAAKDAAIAALARLSAAKRRDELSAQVARASQAIQERPERALGAADTAAALSGLDRDMLASSLDLGGTALMMLMLIMASAFSGDAGARLTDCIRRQKAAGASDATPKGNITKQEHILLADSETEIAASMPRTKEEGTLLRLQSLILHSEQQTLRRSLNSLADLFKVKPATFKDWCAKWREAGKIFYTSVNGETVFQLPHVKEAA